MSGAADSVAPRSCWQHGMFSFVPSTAASNTGAFVDGQLLQEQQAGTACAAVRLHSLVRLFWRGRGWHQLWQHPCLCSCPCLIWSPAAGCCVLVRPRQGVRSLPGP